jgi:hypothetical protein
MRLTLLILALAVCSFAKAQVIIDGVNLNKLENIKYIEISPVYGHHGMKPPFFNGISVDYGQKQALNALFFKQKPDQQIQDANGNNVSFNSMIDAINFFYGNGWDLTQKMNACYTLKKMP